MCIKIVQGVLLGAGTLGMKLFTSCLLCVADDVSIILFYFIIIHNLIIHKLEIDKLLFLNS